jgi:predicted phage terminase large subunit-like protein
LDLWARDHYKSSIITFALTIQNILNDPEITVGIFSHTRNIAKAFLRQIKVELEVNERLKSWFPEILWADPSRESSKWTEDEGIVVKRKSNPKECTVEAWGIVDNQPTGRHFVLMVYDDVVTRDSVTTPDMIKKTTASWELSLNLLRSDGGIVRYIGTRYHYHDTYHTMIERGIMPRIHKATHDGTETGRPVFLAPHVWEQKRREMGDQLSAQMLMEPKSTKDSYFRKDWFRWYDEAPKHLVMYGGSDYATKVGDGDYTVHAVVGIDPDDNMYILEVWREQTTPDIWIDRFCDLVLKHKPMGWAAPRDQIKRSVGPFLEKRMNERKAYCVVEEVSEAGDKPTKARSFQGRMAMGKVYLPKKASWLTDLELELLAFPLGHDDQVDALGVIGRMLEDMIGGQIPVAPEENPRDDYKPTQVDDIYEDEDSWRTV